MINYDATPVIAAVLDKTAGGSKAVALEIQEALERSGYRIVRAPRTRKEAV